MEVDILKNTKCSNSDIVYVSCIPVQIINQKNVSKFEKDIKESLNHECRTKYGDLKKHASFGNIEDVKEIFMPTEKKDESNPNYTVITFDQYKDFGLQRIDERKDSEWQCPTCKHRVKNLQRKKTKEGNPCWGCRKFCDTLDASYFNGKACKLYEEGHSGYVWW